MYTKMITPSALFLLVACGGNPLNNVPTTGGTGTVGTTTQLPGTTSPTSSPDITRYEAPDGNGSGFAESVTYDAGTDTFTVENLAFDGNNTNNRGTAVASLGSYQVYEGPTTTPDIFTGAPIPQFNHRAIHAVSATGQSEFSIVRTGAYVDYGFGGFICSRNGGANISKTGQAI